MIKLMNSKTLFVRLVQWLCFIFANVVSIDNSIDSCNLNNFDNPNTNSNNNNMASTTTRFPVLFINHGGGPMPVMNPSDPLSQELGNMQRHLPAKPKAIIVVSAHWEEKIATITSSPNPEMYFDYGGFPPATYDYKYPAPGNPELANRIQQLLKGSGIPSVLDPKRGYDHGVFIPLMLGFPKHDIPVVAVSLLSSLDPAKHFELGVALKPLRDEGCLIVGSGLSFHNMRKFTLSGPPPAVPAGSKFDVALTKALTTTNDNNDNDNNNNNIIINGEANAPLLTDMQVQARRALIVDWERMPEARMAHPREDHLIPLLVVTGAAGNDVGVRNWGQTTMGAAVSSFKFG